MCTFRSDSISIGCMNTEQRKVPVINDEGFEPLPLHPNPSVKQVCRQQLLAVREGFITFKKLHLPRDRLN